MISLAEVPKEVLDRAVTLRLPSFWQSADGSRWVGIRAGIVEPGSDPGWRDHAPPGTALAYVRDLDLLAEGPDLDSALLKAIELLKTHVSEKGAEIPHASYLEDPTLSTGSLALTRDAWCRTFRADFRLGRPMFPWIVTVRVATKDGAVEIDAIRREEPKA